MIVRTDFRKCQKQQKERACQERFVFMPLWYYGKGNLI